MTGDRLKEIPWPKMKKFLGCTSEVTVGGDWAPSLATAEGWVDTVAMLELLRGK